MIVRLTIPIGVSPTDRLDVQVEVPPACGTTSLAGGYLMMTRLREVKKGPETGPLGGPEMALAQGPIMIGTPAKPKDPKVGRVLGGGKVKKEYPFTLVIKENRESFRTSKMLETVVNERFHQTRRRASKGSRQRQDPQLSRAQGPHALSPESATLLPGRPAPSNDRQPRAAHAPDRGLEQRPARSLDRRDCGDEARGAGNRGRRPPQGGPQEPESRRCATSAPRPWRISTIHRASMSWARPSSRCRSSAPTPWRLWRPSTSRHLI